MLIPSDLSTPQDNPSGLSPFAHSLLGEKTLSLVRLKEGIINVSLSPSVLSGRPVLEDFCDKLTRVSPVPREGLKFKAIYFNSVKYY